jgi:hypothetical protein
MTRPGTAGVVGSGVSRGVAAHGLILPTTTPRPAAALQVDGRLQPRQWLRVLLFPLELLAVAWSLPVVILLLLSPFAVVFWLARVLIAAF